MEQLIKKEGRNWIHSLFIGLFFGVITLVSGFIIISFLYWIYKNSNEYNPNLPGLFDYKAATIGDGILLPLMVFSSTTIINFYSETKILKDKKFIILFAVGIFIGALIQLSWILSDKTNLNWTIPSLHHFNFAGWWHGLFFSVMIGASIVLYYLLWKLFKNEDFPFNNLNSKICYVFFYIFQFSTSGFLYCYIYDDYRKTFNIYLLFSILFIVLTISNSVIFSVIKLKEYSTDKKEKVKEFKEKFLKPTLNNPLNKSFEKIYFDRDKLAILISSQLFSFGLFSFVLLGHPLKVIDIFFSLIGTLLTLTLIHLPKEEENDEFNYQSIYISFLLMLPMLTTQLAILSHFQLTDLNCFGSYIILIFLICLIAFLLEGYSIIKNHFLYLTPILFYPLFCWVVNSLKNPDSTINISVTILEFFFTFLFMRQCVSYIQNEFKEVQKKSDTKIDEEIVKKTEKIYYFNLALYGIGFIIFFFFIIILKPETAGFVTSAKTIFNFNNNILLIGILILILFTAIFSWLNYRIIAIVLNLIAYSLLVYFVIRIYGFSLNFFNENKNGLLILSGFFSSLGSSIFVSFGYYSNTVKLHPNKKDLNLSRFLGIIILISTALITLIIIYSSNLTIFKINAYINVLTILIILGITFILLPFSTSLLFKSKIDPKVDLIMTQPYYGVAQDGMSALLLYLMAGLIPKLYFAYSINENSIKFTGLFVIASTIYWPYIFFLSNNIEHYLKKAIDYKENYSEDYSKDQFNNLYSHLTIQNRLAYISIIPFSIILDLILILVPGCSNLLPLALFYKDGKRVESVTKNKN